MAGRVSNVSSPRVEVVKGLNVGWTGLLLLQSVSAVEAEVEVEVWGVDADGAVWMEASETETALPGAAAVFVVVGGKLENNELSRANFWKGNPNLAPPLLWSGSNDPPVRSIAATDVVTMAPAVFMEALVLAASRSKDLKKASNDGVPPAVTSALESRKASYASE